MGREPTSDGDRRSVEVPLPALAALLAALLGLMLLSAWLLGRESGRRIAEDQRVESATAALGPPPTAPAPTFRTLPTPVPAAPPPAPSAAAPLPSAPERAMPAAVAPGSASGLPPSAESAEAQAVRRYLAEVASLTAGQSGWNDPQQLAMTLVGELTRGESGGLDELMRAQGEVEQRMRSMSVPPPCQAHHQRSLLLLAQARALLGQIRNAALAGDVAAVAGAAAEAQEMAGAAREIEDLERQLRSRYAIPAAG